ncbi:Mitochondrial fission protein [Myotisia sp. PD_48]|nr:Mitochondrial fission protein [Myotisia sp. PD_48]
MANPRRDGSPAGRSTVSGFGSGDDTGSVLGTGLTTRHLEAFGRKVTTTAGQLMNPVGDGTTGVHYQSAMSEIQRELRRPAVQRKLFSFTQTTPTDLMRSKLSTTEIQYRALSSLPDELLQNLPEDTSTYSLFQGFEASLPETTSEHRKSHRRRSSGQKLLGDVDRNTASLPPTIGHLKRERDSLSRRLEMMGVRKNMCSAEIHEIDNKILNLNKMRKIVLDRLAGLEMDEADLEHELVQLDNKLEDMEEALDGSVGELATATPQTNDGNISPIDPETTAMDASFMSESMYEKIPSPKSWRQKSIRKRSMPILHEHFEPGSLIKELHAHNDVVTALDFDVPFGTMVSAAMDDTVRVWDLNLGRCMGFLEGHHASVRCLQVEDNIVATGSMDASIRLWDLSRAKYAPRDHRDKEDEDDEDALGFEDPEAAPPTPPPSSMDDCPLFTLEAHVDEVTALHLRGDMLISGSSDKTLRQWDLVKGRCVQTLDVLWAAAQASSTMSAGDSAWRPTGRLPDASADFVGALQCFDAALACGTADGMVRLWDLRSGQVHRSLVGHTGPVTCLQFDDVHLITGSLDRSIRIWDLRTGSIYDAYAYDHPVTSMMFDTRRIVSAAGEDVVKVYDKADGRHWDCGAGLTAEEDGQTPSIVERVRIKDGYLTEGRKDGTIGIWTC